MNRRNWLSLSRKLVDQYDMDYTLSAIQAALGGQALSFFGEGVQPTTQYPSPFPITMSGTALTGTVGPGSAYDPNGQVTSIGASPDESTTFTIAAASPSNPRWDLLVLTYAQVGDTPVPQPSDPIQTIFLNLHDDFTLAVRKGTPSATPSYPSKQSGDIILAGLQVPAGAAIGTSVFVDLSVRELCQAYKFNYPVFVDEVPTGNVDGINTVFTLSQTPITANGVIVFDDYLYVQPGLYSIVGSTITFSTAPPLGHKITAWYVEGSASSLNPLTPVNQSLGVGTGSTTTFALSGVPVSTAAVQVYLDGFKVLPSEFSLLESAGTASIVFGTAPAAGQSVAAVWFVNSQSLGIGPNTSGVQSVSNIGTGVPVLAGISAQTLQARNIKAGTNVTVTQVAGDIVIASTGGGGGGGGYTRTTFGTFASPTIINPAVSFSPTTDMDQTWWVVPNMTGAQPITASPQISPGTTVGQRLTLKGASPSNYLVISSISDDVFMNGPVDLIDNQTITLEWDGVQWSENSRRI